MLQAIGADPEYTQAFLQACMEEYIALKKEMRTQTSDTTVAGLTEEVMRLEKDLRKADEELVAFQSTNSVVLSQDQGNNSAANYLAALNQRLAAQKSEYELLQLLTVDQNLDRQQQAGRARRRWPAARPTSSRRPAPIERTLITSRPNSSCCSCRPSSRSWAATCGPITRRWWP